MIRIFCGCKINLGLRILARLENGYHELDTLFYPLAWPRDELWIWPGGSGIKTDCEDREIDCEDNLLTRAWHSFQARTCLARGIRMKLVKRIPAGAGLGGGSANAAVLLKWLNEQAGRPLPEAELLKLATGLGADVPFFLVQRPCRATGIGERLVPVAFPGEGKTLVLVCPDIHVSTAWAFAAWDRENCLTKPIDAARNSCSKALDPVNDLEQPIFAAYPCLARIKAQLLDLGAEFASMSGSGSSIYGIFSQNPRANAAAVQMRKHWSRVYVQQMRNFGM